MITDIYSSVNAKERDALQKQIELENQRLLAIGTVRLHDHESQEDFIHNNVDGIDWSRVASLVSILSRSRSYVEQVSRCLQ